MGKKELLMSDIDYKAEVLKMCKRAVCHEIGFVTNSYKIMNGAKDLSGWFSEEEYAWRNAYENLSSKLKQTGT